VLALKFLLGKFGVATITGAAAVLAGGLVKSIPGPVNYSRAIHHACQHRLHPHARGRNASTPPPASCCRYPCSDSTTIATATPAPPPALHHHPCQTPATTQAQRAPIPASPPTPASLHRIHAATLSPSGQRQSLWKMGGGRRCCIERGQVSSLSIATHSALWERCSTG